MNIETFRKKNGYSQQELAVMVGVTQGAVSQWESGLASPSTKKLVELAAVLHCTVDELLKEQNNKTGNLSREVES